MVKYVYVEKILENNRYECTLVKEIKMVARYL